MGQAITLAQLRARICEELGVSRWVVVDQARINAFAEVTGDCQFIHVDPERAARTPFGGAIAHGLLTLSLMGEMAEVFPDISGLEMGVNYGFDKVRFLAPVPAGAAIRARCRLADMSERTPGAWLCRYIVTIEIKDQPQPAMVADWLILNVVRADAT